MPQSINASNDFGSKVMDACKAGAKKAGNVAALNTSTYGVASEVQWNLKVTQDYLDKKENEIALPDTNHNVKNNWSQLIGGSSAPTIGNYVFDP